MQTLIVVLTKGPHRPRRGPKERHDWKVQCRKAAELQRQLPEAVVYVPSAVHITGYSPELEYYRAAFAENGLTESIQLISGRRALILEPIGQETAGQIERGYQFADTLGAKLVVISTLLHFPRVLYLCKGLHATHCIAAGIPNLREAVTDLALAVIFPILDMLIPGFRGWFKASVTRRRKSGKH